ncbi:MAG: hypothetical protein SNF68_04145 [Rikenellaceae bacterium]
MSTLSAKSQEKEVVCSSIVKVANVSVYSDTYKYTFGNPIKLNGNRKSSFASGTLSLLIPGLGHFYNGDEVGGCVYLLANVLTKVWLIYPPTKTTITSVNEYSAAYEIKEDNYMAPIIANVAVTLISFIDAMVISKRVNDAREGFLIGNSSYLNIEPTLLNTTPM